MVDISIVVETHLCISPYSLNQSLRTLLIRRNRKNGLFPSPRTAELFIPRNSAGVEKLAASANPVREPAESLCRDFLLEFVNYAQLLNSANLMCELKKLIYLKMISELKLIKTKECNLKTVAIKFMNRFE